MPFKDYAEFAQPLLALPINGKTYTIPEVPAALGITLLNIDKTGEGTPELQSGVDLWRAMLGPAWDEMLADGVPFPAMSRAGMTALADYQAGREVAELVWETGDVNPEALAVLAAAKLQASMPSISTAVATTTKRRASTSGTTSPKARKRTETKPPE